MSPLLSQRTKLRKLDLGFNRITRMQNVRRTSSDLLPCLSDRSKTQLENVKDLRDLRLSNNRLTEMGDLKRSVFLARLLNNRAHAALARLSNLQLESLKLNANAIENVNRPSEHMSLADSSRVADHRHFQVGKAADAESGQESHLASCW